MPLRIEDYGLIGDTQTAGLVGRDGSIDWLCLPRFDSPACFASLLGSQEHGRWRIAPVSGEHAVRRRYRGDSLVLEHEFETASGIIRLLDFMPVRHDEPDIIRIVEGLGGTVDMRMELAIRFDYGSIVPWVTIEDGVLLAVAGPDALSLWSPVETSGEGLSATATFTMRAGDRLPFVMAWHPSHQPAPSPVDPIREARETERWWQDWADRCTYEGPWRSAVVRSLVTLKALTFAPTGGIVAAATTSLPEQLGGPRNWDYRHCWLRDATFTLYALIVGGYTGEAAAWRNWLQRAVAGRPHDLQIMYGCAGERRLTELELPWLPGYANSRPVRIGNRAVHQRQLDVFGEVMDALYLAKRCGLETDLTAWTLQRELLNHLQQIWHEPDEGIWEVRGPRRHFTHSKVMAWVAFDRAIQIAEHWNLEGPVAEWKRLRAQIHADVCERGFNTTSGTFTQFYGTDRVDASLLMIPLVGFLRHDDPRVTGTVAAIKHRLMSDGFVHRYAMDEQTQAIDGLPPGEGVFLACTCWLADNYALQERYDKAAVLFERLLAVRNDLGLLSEQYDPVAKRLVGNFPQAFSHVGVINTARNLSRRGGPAQSRGEES
jgi:GH15 family glucan-1,4-alpha-glucosidase